MTARFATALVLLASACSAPPSGSKPPDKEPRRITMFVTTELRGSIEPCGCTTDPLGDLARTTELVLAARKSDKPVLVVDGGSLLYTLPKVPAHLEAQEVLKADLLARAYSETLQAAAIGFGPFDLGMGLPGVKLPRQVANLDPASGITVEAPKVIDAGGVRVGLFGVVSPASVAGHGVQATDPVPAAQAAVATLRKQGARLVVGLAHMTRKEATALARSAPGIDILVVGQNAPEPDQVATAPHQVGDTYLVQPANRGQIVTQLDFAIRDQAGSLTDAIGEARAEIELRRAETESAELEKSLAQWKSDSSADPAFVKAKEQELAELEAYRTRLRASPVQAPAQGSWFVMSQVRISKGLPCNESVQTAKTAFDKAAGAANVAAAQNVKPPAPEPGKPGYVGVEECSYCHSEAVTFWEKTRHPQAWDTLEEVSKQFNYECISCHVTGWDQPGGSTLAFNEPLRDVQCETCHGPGSLHVAADGKEVPKTMIKTPPESLCKGCHNSEHSDTFDYQAYLRDVTGPGHGMPFRTRLGDGPTGRELRKAGLERAGSTIGAGCLK